MGRIRIYYPSTTTDKWQAAVGFDNSKWLIRCFDSTCTETGVVVEHDSTNRFVDISKLFEAPEFVRKTGNSVRFSLSGWTLPAPTSTDTSVALTFNLESKWKEDTSTYSIDRYEGFILTLQMPTEKPIVSYSVNYSGGVAELKVRYNL